MFAAFTALARLLARVPIEPGKSLAVGRNISCNMTW